VTSTPSRPPGAVDVVGVRINAAGQAVDWEHVRAAF
jgi:hypothetical protein